MPYKSKRTRDLQGKVVAGSGITITEQTKPDGTKEYTITNGDPASAITVDGTGLSLISNVLRNTMAAIMGWSGDDSRGAINWTDDNGDTVLKIIPLQELFIGDAHDNNDFIIKHINGENRLIRGTLQIAENINSTEGVSLNTLVSNVQTLADMSNSASLWYVGYDTSFTYSSVFYLTYSFFWEIPPYPNYNDNIYFEENTNTGYTIDDNELYGLLVKQGGVYKINLSGFTYGINSGVELENQVELCLGVVRNNNYVTLRIFATWANKLPNGASCTHFINFSDVGGIFELEENDVIVSYINLYSSSSITGYGFLGDNPILSIQKVR